jgi:hypothetical protein
MRHTRILIAGLAGSLASAAVAQLGPVLPQVGTVLRPVTGALDTTMQGVTRTVRDLSDARLSRIAALVRANPGRVALDPQGFPARAGEIVLTDVDVTVVTAIVGKGFTVIDRGDALGVGFVRLATPPRMSLKAAIRLAQSLGAKDVSADQIYTGSGDADVASPPAAGNGPRIGLIDGGVAGGGSTQRGFASGAPKASVHGTAVASLIAGTGRIRGSAPGARLYVADVYGSDPAGGNATAIVQALGWMAEQRVPVVNISLVGPPNPLLGRVVAAAQARGMIIVAAVGNDGAASPPSYPASYPGVIAVTATDARKRVLIEAGRATHLDYAAPGADMLAADMAGGTALVRGTSFAAPIVAGSIARVYALPDPSRRAAALSTVDAAAERLGSRYGRGLVCAPCRTPAK